MGAPAASKVAAVGVIEACKRGIIITEDEGGGSGATPQSIKIKHMAQAAYTLIEADANFMLVFAVAGTVTITLPAIASAQDTAPFTIVVVNTLGPIDLVTAQGENLVAYAPHAEQNASIGLLRGSENWYATGTNAKPEDQ